MIGQPRAIHASCVATPLSTIVSALTDRGGLCRFIKLGNLPQERAQHMSSECMQNSARLQTCHVMGWVHARVRRLAGIGAHVMASGSCMDEGVQPSGKRGKPDVRNSAE